MNEHRDEATTTSTKRQRYGRPSMWRRWLRLPIYGGAAKGLWWYPGAGGKVVRLVSGTYERVQAEAFVQQIGPGDVVLDVGAHAGYYSLLAARLVGQRGRIVALEPCPKNAWFLRQHVTVNRLSNVTVIQGAAGDAAGITRFKTGKGTATGCLSADGNIDTQVYRLDDIVSSENVDPTHLKIDVEGAEAQVLRGAAHILCACRPTLFLSIHGEQASRDCREVLADFDYNVRPLLESDPSELFCTPDESAQWSTRVERPQKAIA